MKILTMIICSLIVLYVFDWLIEEDTFRELTFSIIGAIVIAILCILELLGVISF